MSTVDPNWEVVIGLEIHAQLATKSKIFSGASTAYGAEPNTQTSVVDIALPGVLPVLNKEAVHMAVKFGMAIDAEVADRSVFARKNYFYPDLPKGYQISQFDLPIVGMGHVNIELENGETEIEKKKKKRKRSEENTTEHQQRGQLICRFLLEKKKLNEKKKNKMNEDEETEIEADTDYVHGKYNTDTTHKTIQKHVRTPYK